MGCSQNTVSSDMHLLGADPWVVQDCDKWRVIGRRKATQHCPELRLKIGKGEEEYHPTLDKVFDIGMIPTDCIISFTMCH